MAKAPDMKVVVELSPRDRALLRRIVDKLDPVMEPKSGPRRLREPDTSFTDLNPNTPLSYAALATLAGVNEDARVALTAAVEKGITPPPTWSEPVNGVQYRNSWVVRSGGAHLDAGYTELALRYGNARRKQPSVLERLIGSGGVE